MKKSTPYWIRIANYAHRIVPEPGEFDKQKAAVRKQTADRIAAYKEGFTPKEWRIINGKPSEKARVNEIIKLINKCEERGRFDLADQLRDMYEDLLDNEPYGFDRLSEEEALEILRSLTPDDMKGE